MVLYVQVWELTCHRHGLCQTECDRLPICIVKLCHSLRVPVYLGQEHALAAGVTHAGDTFETCTEGGDTAQTMRASELLYMLQVIGMYSHHFQAKLTLKGTQK